MIASTNVQASSPDHSLSSDNFFCSNFLTPEKSRNDTQVTLAYLTSLLEEGILREEYLLKLISDLKAGKAPNPFESTSESSSLEIHKKTLDLLMRSDQIDTKTILTWAEKTQIELDRIKTARAKIKVETAMGQPISFHRVKARKFSKHFAGVRGEITATLEHDLFVMDKPVTEFQYFSLVGGDQPKIDSIDHPANQYCRNAAIFANELSKKEGIEPYYEIDSTTKNVVGMINPSGFRLPFLSEKHFLQNTATTGEGRHALGLSAEELLEYAWTLENSDCELKTVATRKPLFIDGNPFYDLIGNANEVTEDIHSNGRYQDYGFGANINAKDIKNNLLGPASNSHVISGNEFFFGFRLVRIAPKDKQ